MVPSMQNYKVLISDTAERDLLNSYYYIYFELNNPVAAEKFRSAVYNKISSLSEIPFAGEKHSLFPDFRVVHALKYRIFYIVDKRNKTVLVSRVFFSKHNEPKIEEL